MSARIEVGEAGRTFHTWASRKRVETNNTYVVVDYKKPFDQALIIASDGLSHVTYVARTPLENIARIYTDTDTGCVRVRFHETGLVRTTTVLDGHAGSLEGEIYPNKILPLTKHNNQAMCIEYARIDPNGPIVPLRISQE